MSFDTFVFISFIVFVVFLFFVLVFGADIINYIEESNTEISKEKYKHLTELVTNNPVLHSIIYKRLSDRFISILEYKQITEDIKRIHSDVEMSILINACDKACERVCVSRKDKKDAIQD